MRLKKLELLNFKGMRSFTFEPNGENVSVFGDNATGKTTIMDSVTWLLFGKDSEGRADFNVKTLDANNEPLHNLNYEVAATFTLPEGDVALKKVFFEKYTKKRGSAESVFSGHTTEYYIDGVPKTEGEYKKFIESISPEKIFRLLTSPAFFSEQLKWQERRQVLFDIIGNLTDQDVIANNPELAELAGVIGNRSIDDAKKVEQATRNKINNELQEIPQRIDEASRAIPENAEKVNIPALRNQEAGIEAKINDLRGQRIIALSGGLVAQKKQQLTEVDTAIMQLKNKHIQASMEFGKEDRQALQNALYQLSLTESHLSAAKIDLDRLQKKLETLKVENKAIVDRWKAQNGLKFTPDGVCQTCGQNYPPHLLAKQEADFNRTKAQALEVITADGQENKKEIDSVQGLIAECEAKIEQLSPQAATEKQRLDELRAAVGTIQEPPKVESLPEYEALISERSAIEKAIAELQAGSQEELAGIDQQITILQGDVAAIRSAVVSHEAAENQKKRIEELKARQKELAKQFEHSEKVLYLLDLFLETKVNLLEESINSRFSLVKWKLFDEQVNGGLSETCVCTINGVPYSDLNNAGRIQAGIDIINTLSRYHGFAPCVFVDNAESVTRIPETDGQLIKLVVSEPDKVLRVELK